MTSLDRLYNTQQVRLAAKRILPGVLFDYVDGDAEDGASRRANRDAYAKYALRQRVPTSSAPRINLGVDVLGRSLDIPVIVAPCGLAAVMHPDGPIGANRAATNRGTVAVLSTVAGTSPADLAADVDDPGWFQLYAPQGREGAEPLLEEVHKLGFSALFVTTDTAVLGRRERDTAHGVSLTMKINPRIATHMIAQFAVKPTWVSRLVRDQVERRRAIKSGSSDRAPAKLAVPGMGASPFTWDDIAWIRERWDGPLVVKGLVDADDARRAVDVGAQGVVVSNHGGRQLDGALGALDALPAIVDAVGDQIEVIMDGGIRRGTDIIKALALGAKAVQIGRPWLFGLAVDGQAGVEHVLKLYKTELLNALALMDVTSVAELTPDHLIATT